MLGENFLVLSLRVQFENYAHWFASLMVLVVDSTVVGKWGCFPIGELIFSDEQVNFPTILAVFDDFPAALADRGCRIL